MADKDTALTDTLLACAKLSREAENLTATVRICSDGKGTPYANRRQLEETVANMRNLLQVVLMNVEEITDGY